MAWAEKTSREVKEEQDKLEHELKSYKNNLIKESIRVCTCNPYFRRWSSANDVL
jgi:hypothetical protein